MEVKYVLDACALIAFLNKETGGGTVRKLLKAAGDKNIEIFMNKLNMFEVYYGFYRAEGCERANSMYRTVGRLPIILIDGISDSVLQEAARIKSLYRMSLADSIALGEASIRGALLVTSDHHEFDPVEKCESIAFEWIR